MIVILLVGIILLVIYRYWKVANIKESFTATTTRKNYEHVEGVLNIYDAFYVDHYAKLYYDPERVAHEIGEIVIQTEMDAETSNVLDVCCGLGYHLQELVDRGIACRGIDNSEAMIQSMTERMTERMEESMEERVTKKMVKKADVLNQMTLPAEEFTHVMCLGYGIYHFRNKYAFFRNTFHWLSPGGYLIVHLVNRDKLSTEGILTGESAMSDTILSGSGSESESKEKGKKTVQWGQMKYTSTVTMNKTTNELEIKEKFVDWETGKVRDQTWYLYVPPQSVIVEEAKKQGFRVLGKVQILPNLTPDFHYLYIFQKPI